jgi:uncharacterized protein
MSPSVDRQLQSMTVDPIFIIEKFYDPRGRTCALLVRHGLQVAAKSMAVAQRIPRLNPNLEFIREAALLHDIGIFMTCAPDLGCTGRHPYVCHGFLGREILEEMGLPAHAAVCERHVGAGLTKAEIRSQGLPLPQRDMLPESIEEQIITYADNFFSKRNPQGGELTAARIVAALGRYSPAAAARFRAWHELFDPPRRHAATRAQPFSKGAKGCMHHRHL